MRESRPIPSAATPADEALERARVLVDDARRTGMRRLLGITGAPGAGKSTLTAHLAEQLPAGSCAVVPMDGFHLADVALERLGRLDRKGAPDTFDAEGYLTMLRRVRTADPGQAPVWWPSFERELEQPLAGALEIPAAVPLVITEGNYLLLEDAPWPAVAAELSVCWWIEVPAPLRRSRLITRHVRFGKSEQEATAWVDRVDEANARLVEPGRERADRVIDSGP